MTPVRRLGLAFNPTKPTAVELCRLATEWCRELGLEQWSAPAADLHALRAQLPTTDVLLVLGGDGTFLLAARAVVESDVPVMGVNLGKVGFLSRIEANELRPILDELRDGAFEIEERMVLEGSILRGGRASMDERYIAVNDVVVTSAAIRDVPSAVKPELEPRYTE